MRLSQRIRLALVLFLAWAAIPAISSAAPDGAYPPIAFVGQTYDFYKKQKITLGWALHFAPAGQDPDRADQAIVINYYDRQDDQGHAISAEGIARSMAIQDKDRGATLLPPFATPDPSNPGKYIFFITVYYIYPKDRNGDIWIGKVLQVGNGIVGMLYKQQVYGADDAAIAESVKRWLLRNLNTYGGALSTLAPPPGPK